MGTGDLKNYSQAQQTINQVIHPVQSIPLRNKKKEYQFKNEK